MVSLSIKTERNNDLQTTNYHKVQYKKPTNKYGTIPFCPMEPYHNQIILVLDSI